METALAMEVDAVRRSVIYCREVLGIGGKLGNSNQQARTTYKDKVHFLVE